MKRAGWPAWQLERRLPFGRSLGTSFPHGGTPVGRVAGNSGPTLASLSRKGASLKEGAALGTSGVTPNTAALVWCQNYCHPRAQTLQPPPPLGKDTGAPPWGPRLPPGCGCHRCHLTTVGSTWPCVTSFQFTVKNGRVCIGDNLGGS